jgi:general secretion pathway protein G
MKTIDNRQKSKRAFSMLELIFVIIVLGILASIAIPNLSATRSDAKAVSVKSDIKLATDSIVAYYTAKGSISDISDSVTLDDTRWSLAANTNGTANLAYIFKTVSNDKECLRLEIDDATSSDKKFIIAIAKNSTGTTGNDDIVCGQLRKMYNKWDGTTDSLGGSSINSSPIYYIKILTISLDSTGISF